MAGLNPAAVREAVKAQLDNAGLARTVAVHLYHPGGDDDDAITQYPCIIIGWADSADYRETFGAQGIASLPLELDIRTQAADPRSAEKALDDLLAAGTGADSSIFDALDADVTLDATVSVSQITMTQRPEPQRTPNGVLYWSARLSLACRMPRS
jgi:hypothetical protein